MASTRTAGQPTTDSRHTATADRLSADELRKMDAYWRACNYLAAGMIYLRDNPLLREPLQAEHIKQRLLGHWGASPGLELRLRPPQPPDQQVRPGRDLPRRSGPRRAGRAGAGLSRRHLLGGLSEQGRGRGGACARFFKEFSFPGGIGSHCTPETPGLDPRGRRAGLQRLARVRRRVRQPGPARRGRRRRRRSRDRAAGDVLALQQVPQPDPRRRGAADPASQRLQDQQPDAAGAHLPRGAGEPVQGLRLDAALRRGRRSRSACTRRWPRRWRSACWRSGASSRRRAAAASRRGRAGR